MYDNFVPKATPGFTPIAADIISESGPVMASRPASPVTITSMISMRVTDTRTSRSGWLNGPVFWSRGRLYASVRMTDTGRSRHIRTDALRLTPNYPSPVSRRKTTPWPTDAPGQNYATKGN
jgi:hypothetical protein